MIGGGQFPIIPSIAPGDGIQRLAWLYDMFTPVDRRVIKVVLIDSLGSAAANQRRQQQNQQPWKQTAQRVSVHPGPPPVGHVAMTTPAFIHFLH